MPGEYMTLEKAAEFLNMSTDAVNLLMEKGFAKKDKAGNILVKRVDIMQWFNRGIKDLNVAQLNKLEKDFSNRSIMIHPLLSPECIITNILGRRKIAIITELVDQLVEKGGVEKKHRDKILSAIIERERMCSTALADGVAIPHPREPLAGIIRKPRIVMGLSWTGVDFESFDGKLTHIVALLCVPKLENHLQILAKMSRLLRNPKLRVSLCRSKSPQEVIDQLAKFEEEKSI
jgi:mannitol/fructose-specific phosphotransferase system IIA component (Ntr-type)